MPSKVADKLLKQSLKAVFFCCLVLLLSNPSDGALTKGRAESYRTFFADFSRLLQIHFC